MKFYALCGVVVLGLFIYGGQGSAPVIKEALSYLDDNLIEREDYEKQSAEQALFSLVGRLKNELYPFYDEKTGKIGYFDSFGNVDIEPQFDTGENFNYGYAVVGLEDKVGIIDNNKEIVVQFDSKEKVDIPNRKEEINELVKKLESYSDYKISKKINSYGVKDKTGRYIIKPKYDEIKLMESNNLKEKFPDIKVNYDIFIGNYAVVRDGNKDILVDKNGNEVKNLDYTKLKLSNEFILGYKSSQSDKVSVINLQDIKSSKEFLKILYIDKDRAIIKNDDGYKIIDAQGNSISKTYKHAYVSSRSNHKFIFADDKFTYLIDREGEKLKVFNKVYDKFYMYSSNLYFGQNDGKTGEYLNSEGEIVGYYKE
ncbi:MAG: WG repeat-containing protein [Peptostreptococcaceae bacterium]